MEFSLYYFCHPNTQRAICEYRTDEQGNVSSAKPISNIEGEICFVFIQHSAFVVGCSVLTTILRCLRTGCWLSTMVNCYAGNLRIRMLGCVRYVRLSRLRTRRIRMPGCGSCLKRAERTFQHAQIQENLTATDK
jgi:hypothetical protein